MKPKHGIRLLVIELPPPITIDEVEWEFDDKDPNVELLGEANAKGYVEGYNRALEVVEEHFTGERRR